MWLNSGGASVGFLSIKTSLMRVLSSMSLYWRIVSIIFPNSGKTNRWAANEVVARRLVKSADRTWSDFPKDPGSERDCFVCSFHLEARIGVPFEVSVKFHAK